MSLRRFYPKLTFMRIRSDPKSSITGMPSGMDFTGHTEKTHIQCDASLDSEFLESDEVSSFVRNEVAAVRSNPQSPSRRTTKERRQEIRSRLVKTLEADSQVSTTRFLTIHYFWGSRFFLSIYVLIFMSLLLRQWVILHGVSIMIIWRIVERFLVWGLFIWRSNEVKSIGQHVRWVSKFAFTQAGKAAEGDRWRGFIATQSFNFWTGTGKNFLQTFFRLQTSWIRNRALKETENALEQQTIAKRMALHASSFRLKDNFRR